MNDFDAANLFYNVHRIAQTPGYRRFAKELKASKPRKPEWGRPVEEYIHDAASPNFDISPPASHMVRAAIDSVQLNKRGVPRPTCDTFRIILGLLRDPASLTMLIGTTMLSSCTHLLREHVKDTKEPMFCYEYGYLCFEVMALTTQVAIIARKDTGGFDTFMVGAKQSTRTSQLPILLAVNTALQVHIGTRESKNQNMSWLLRSSPTAGGGRTFLPDVGGMTDLDGVFLIKTLWESRKQLSFIGSQAAMHGWSFIIRILGEHLLNDFASGKRDPIMWGFLETICHRYGLVAGNDETEFVVELCSITGDICSDETQRHYVQGMEDEEDARTVVESYIARLTPKPDVEPLPIFFCATLVDFVFQERISALGEVLVPLLRLGYERIWAELKDETMTKDVGWSVDMAQCIINTLGCTERFFGAEHKFQRTQVESFIHTLYGIDLIGLVGQAILIPTSLQPAPEVDQCWARIVKTVVGYGQTLAYSRSSSFASKLFADTYSDWLNALRFIQRQLLYEPSRERSLRANAPGAELAWMNVGKIFGFVERMEREQNWNTHARKRNGCANPRCTGAIHETMACERCLGVEYCSRVCQNIHWTLSTLDPHRRSCVRVR